MILIIACGEEEHGEQGLAVSRSCSLTISASQVQSGEMVDFSMLFKDDGRTIHDTAYFIDDERVIQNSVFTGDLSLGKHSIRGRLMFTDSTDCEAYRSIEVMSDVTPDILGVEVLKSFDHDASSFTQGLTWHDGRLYEGTGNFGESFIHHYDIDRLDYSQRTELDMTYFGEGITILGNRLFQLTYKAGEAFVYDLETMERIGSFGYSGEGWGLTDDGTHLIMSDGSHILRFIDPQTFQVVREQGVYADKGKLTNINEMEYVDGVIYANIYTADHIARIDPTSGKVLAFIDCRGLLPNESMNGNEDVLNGIAYNPLRRSFYLTGKYWPEMFEVRFTETGS